MLLENMDLFLRIVEKGTMAAAARDLGISPARVSERLVALEAHYGARLLTRTTRSISLTEEGRSLVEGARRILSEAGELESRIRLGSEQISGNIHICAPVDLGRNRIAPLLDSFISRHPDIKLELSLSDAWVDLVAQGADLAIRFGDLSDSTLRTRGLGKHQRMVLASPQYLKKYGTPQHPDDLEMHNCILMRFGNKVDRDWKFRVAGKLKTWRVSGNRIVDDSELARTWCRAGYGIAFKSTWDAFEDLRSGALVPILSEFNPSLQKLQIVYPAGAHQPKRVRMVMDHIANWFTQHKNA